jgi:hypothetical protein
MLFMELYNIWYQYMASAKTYVIILKQCFVLYSVGTVSHGRHGCSLWTDFREQNCRGNMSADRIFFHEGGNWKICLQT